MKLAHLIESKLDDNKEYVRTIYAAGHPNPMGRGVIFVKGTQEENGYIVVELKPMVDFVHITEIHVLEGKNKQGYGSTVMKILTDQADKMKIDLHLTAIPLRTEGKKITKAKLKQFYKKHGFVSEGGDIMRREPQ